MTSMQVKYNDIKFTITNEDTINDIFKLITGYKKNITRKSWSKEDDIILQEMYEENISSTKIANHLNRTIKAVQTRIWLLKNNGTNEYARTTNN